MKKLLSIILASAVLLANTGVFAALQWVDIGENIFTDIGDIYTSSGTAAVDTSVSCGDGSSVKVEGVWSGMNEIILEANGFASDCTLDAANSYHISMKMKLSQNTASVLPEKVRLSLNTNYEVMIAPFLPPEPYTESTSAEVLLSATEDWQTVEAYLTPPAPQSGSDYTFKGYSVSLKTLEACFGVIAWIDEIKVFEAEQQRERYINLIPNPTCDTLTNFTKFWNVNWEIDNTVKSEGTGSIKVTGGASTETAPATYPIFTDQITGHIPGDAQLYLKMDAKGDTPGNAMIFCMEIELPPKANGDPQTQNVTITRSTVPAEWTTFEHTFTINNIWGDYANYRPDQIKGYKIYVQINKGDVTLMGNNWWFDNMSLREVPEALGSFEMSMQTSSPSSSEAIAVKSSAELEIRQGGSFKINGKVLTPSDYIVVKERDGSSYVLKLKPNSVWLNDTAYTVEIDGLVYDAWGRNLSENKTLSFTTRKKVTLGAPTVVNENGKTKVSITVTNNETSPLPAVMIAAAYTNNDLEATARWSLPETIASGDTKTLTAELDETSKPIRLMVLDDTVNLRSYDDVVLVTR